MLTKVEYPCPNCQNLFKPKALIKKPFKGALKSYQFTPAPSIHCPHCEQKLKAIFPVQYAWGLVGLVVLICLMIIAKSIFDLQFNKMIDNVITASMFLIAIWLFMQIVNQLYYAIDDD
ncbi:Uncharacterised protein [Moraxella bovis]|uniref:Cxxc_20_cxxc protein n=2 Tax=Moraxella bovis TaxID=476 RepID=A0A378PQD2_MORBO|nr:Uncharacterised protein [Moraxella bovis]